MKKIVLYLLLLTFMLSLVSFARADGLPSGAKAIVTVRTGGLNMRAGATGNSPIIDQLKNGAVVTVISRTGDWYCVSTGGTSGFVHGAFLRLYEQSAAQPSQTPQPTWQAGGQAAQGTARVSTQGGKLNLRGAASYQGAVVGRLPNGATVSLLERAGDWYRIRTGVLEGYVLSRFLNVSAQTATASPLPSPTWRPTSGTQQIAYVNTRAGSLNLRASIGGAVIGTLARGTAVTVLSQSGEWARVSSGGKTGYVKNSFLSYTAVAPSATPTGTGGRTAYAGSALTLRQRPDDASASLAQIPMNASLTVRTDGSAWSYVTYGALTGYVHTDGLRYAAGGQMQKDAIASSSAVNDIAVIRNGTNIRLYNMPTSDASAYRRLLTPGSGEQITVVERATTVGGDAWSRIQCGGESGWVHSGEIVAASGSVSPTAGGAVAYVNTRAGSLNLRASIGGAVIGTLARGTAVTVLSQSGEWARVSSGGKTGYVKNSFLSYTAVAPSATPTGTGAGIAYAAVVLTLRERPDDAAPRLAEIPVSAALTVLTRGSVWSYVTYGAFTGYVRTSGLRAASDGAPQKDAVVSSSAVHYAAVIRNGSSIRLYGAPTSNASDYRQVLNLNSGETLDVLEQASTFGGNAWNRVQYSGVSGWVRSEEITAASGGQSAQGGTSATPITQNDAKAVVRQALNGTGFNPDAFPENVQFFAEDNASAPLGLKRPYYLFTYFDFNGQKVCEIAVHAYTREVLYNSLRR